jgi:hypothetical protein
MSKQMMPLSDAAKVMQTTPLNVLMHIKRGLLKGVEEKGQWMVDHESMKALLAKTGGGKADDVCSSGCDKKHACVGGCG